MSNVNTRNKILGIVSIAVLGAFAYMAVKSFNSSTPAPNTAPNTQNQTSQGVGGGAQEVKPETVKTLLYRLNLPAQKSSKTEKPIVQLMTIDLNGNNKKLVFTDLDEDFQIRLVNGLLKDSVLAFATPLNETSGSIWQIKIDGSGVKKQLIDKFTSSSLDSNGEKIAFVSYNNVNGTYGLWIMDLDGRFKTKILESNTVLSDPVIVGKTIYFVKIDKEGNGVVLQANLDGSNQKEILKGKNELIYSLFYAANKLTYIKVPKAGGQENLAEVYVFDISSQKESKITSDKDSEGYPVLSQDGTKIAFYKGGKIWVGNSDGSDLKSLIEGNQPIGFLN